MKTNKEIAEELVGLLSTSEYHNIAWALKDTLEKMKELLYRGYLPDWKDELEVMYCNGYDDCLKRINGIIDELEEL